ncbi:peptidylprolyl isomerase [Pelagibacterales bacterium SAG-MED47]|nr:peptidylprolyl isomerase [Pelagibacterales bacterium SAG-MED47]
MIFFDFKKYFLVIVYFILILTSDNLYSKEVKIVTKIENEIITNIDIENEYKYLITFNKSLQEMNREKVYKFAKESLIKEKIKKIEIVKYHELNKKNEMIDVMIKNLYQNIGINSKDEFKKYLKTLDLDFDKIYKKIEIEGVWNQMIYSKYRNKVIINQEKIKKKIRENPKKNEVFLLSELIYDFKNQEEIKEKYQKILMDIQSIGFKEAVIKYSNADSKNNFGLIGWVNKNTLSKIIKEKLDNLDIGEITDPILVPAGALILKIDDKKLEKLDTNLDEELKKIIQYETNTQLNNYSVLYYNKVKNNLTVNEF